MAQDIVNTETNNSVVDRYNEPNFAHHSLGEDGLDEDMLLRVSQNDPGVTYTH